jgi:hypothetical protein
VILDRREAVRFKRPQCGAVDHGRFEIAVAGDRDRSVVAVPWLVAKVQVGFNALQVWKDVREAPPGIPERLPLVVVGR